MDEFEDPDSEDETDDTASTAVDEDDSTTDALTAVCCSPGAQEVFLSVFAVLAAGGIWSWVRVRGTDDPDLQEMNDPREYGETVIPFVGLNAAYQSVESDVDAADLRLETGIGPVGVVFRETHYEEQRPDDELDLIQWHFLYRMSYTRHAEFDIGLGGLYLRGQRRTSAFSLSLPVRLQPSAWVGIHFRPTWGWPAGATAIQDYDLGVSLGPAYVAVQIGYRWVRRSSATLDGPFAGVQFSF